MVLIEPPEGWTGGEDTPPAADESKSTGKPNVDERSSQRSRWRDEEAQGSSGSDSAIGSTFDDAAALFSGNSTGHRRPLGRCAAAGRPAPKQACRKQTPACTNDGHSKARTVAAHRASGLAASRLEFRQGAENTALVDAGGRGSCWPGIGHRDCLSLSAPEPKTRTTRTATGS